MPTITDPTRAGLMMAALSGLLMLLLPGQAEAWQIDGLHPFSPVTGEMVRPVVLEGRLEIALAGEGRLSAGPWPGFLPAKYGPQFVQARRVIQPGGPEDMISLAHGRNKRAWLLMGDGTRKSGEIVGGWRLAYTGAGWWLERAGIRHSLGSSPGAASVTVTADGARWCVRLLESRIPQRRAGIALEEEAQAGWVAVRLHGRLRHC